MNEGVSGSSGSEREKLNVLAVAAKSLSGSGELRREEMGLKKYRKRNERVGGKQQTEEPEREKTKEALRNKTNKKL